jgi:hypothetical protein
MKRRKWTEEELYLEALKYESRSEFAKKSAYTYGALLKKGLLDEACSHMEEKLHFWTNEELHLEALKYKTRWEFQLGSRNAQATAQRRGIMDQICSHMEETFVHWTFEKIQEIALLYKSRREFELNNNVAYQAASRMKIMDIVCKHMKSPKGTSLPEKELLAIIKLIYPNAKKFRDMKVNIEGKPHIKGFDLDIRIGNKGIEFDGEYWHSFEGLKKGRNKKYWPEEDVKKYHEIKNSWFASKNIQILHIKEEDWNIDKEACIKKCLDFLGE